MPQITTYVRNADLPLWKALPNKSEAIHNMLHDSLSSYIEPQSGKALDKESHVKPLNIKKNKDGTLSPIDPSKPSSVSTDNVRYVPTDDFGA